MHYLTPGDDVQFNNIYHYFSHELFATLFFDSEIISVTSYCLRRFHLSQNPRLRL